MPIEARYLKDAPYPEVKCPNCGTFPLEPFLRGLIQRSPYWFKWQWPFFGFRPYCAIICSKCKEIVGYEAVQQQDVHRFWQKRQEKIDEWIK